MSTSIATASSTTAHKAGDKVVAVVEGYLTVHILDSEYVEGIWVAFQEAEPEGNTTSLVRITDQVRRGLPLALLS